MRMIQSTSCQIIPHWITLYPPQSQKRGIYPVSLPRIAVSQAPYVRDVEVALNRVLAHMRQAAGHGMDIIVFPEWFMGLNPVEVIPNRLTQRIGTLAKELNLLVITGSLRVLDNDTGKKQQRGMIIERDGTLIGSQAKMGFVPTERPWFEPGLGISPITTSWGKFVILLGLDAIDPIHWNATLATRPRLVVLATSANTTQERHHLQELAVTRSLELDGTVILSPLLGRFGGAQHVGGAVIAHQGRIISSAEDDETLVMAQDPKAPLVQLGVVDVSSYMPLCPAPKGFNLDPKKTLGPEAEKRVLLDWGALRASDMLGAGREILSQARGNPRWVALAPARPMASRELGILLEDGAAGAFTYPGLDGIAPYSEPIRDLGKVLSLHRRPLIVHTGPGVTSLRYDRPILWDDFLLEFPTVPVVLLHMGGRSPYLEEALLLAERHAQVWLETSQAPLLAIKEALAAIPDRLLFGSGGLARDFAVEWDKISQIEPSVPPDVYQNLLHNNALSLFFSDSSFTSRETLRIVRRPS